MGQFLFSRDVIGFLCMVRPKSSSLVHCHWLTSMMHQDSKRQPKWWPFKNWYPHLKILKTVFQVMRSYQHLKPSSIIKLCRFTHQTQMSIASEHIFKEIIVQLTDYLVVSSQKWPYTVWALKVVSICFVWHTGSGHSFMNYGLVEFD